MAPLVSAAGVTCRLAETLSPSGSEGTASCVVDLQRLREELLSAIHLILQMVRVVSSYHCYFNKANSWYNLVLCENIFHKLPSGVDAADIPTEQCTTSGGTVSLWRLNLSTFLQKNPPPDTEELLHLARLSDVVPGDVLQQAGRQMSERCMILRNLLISSAPVDADDVKLALQWQQELLQSSHFNSAGATDGTTEVVLINPQASHFTTHDSGKDAAHHLSPLATISEMLSEDAAHHLSPLATISEMLSATGKSFAIRAFDSGFDGDVSSRLEDLGGREGLDHPSRLLATRDSVRQTLPHPQIQEELNNREESEPSSTKVQIATKVTEDTLNFEIKLKLLSLQQCNPLHSLPVSELENSFPTTTTDACNQSKEFPVPPANVEALSSMQPKRHSSRCWVQRSQSTLEYPEFSPIRNVLSSTITDVMDESFCTTEGIPSLLWDSYDLHDHNQEASDGHHYWSWSSSDDQLGVMSFSRLTDAAYLGLEDNFDPKDCDNLSEDTLTGLASKTRVSEHDEHCNDASIIHSWLSALTEPISSESPERKVFRLKLNGEKSEVRFEKMLHKGKKQKDRLGTDYLPFANSEEAQSNITFKCTSKVLQTDKNPKTFRQEFGTELRISGENATIWKPEASLIPERRPDDGVFDPGGETVCPPRPVPSNDITKRKSPRSTELPNSALSAVAPGAGLEPRGLQNKSVKTRQEKVSPAGTIFNQGMKEHGNSCHPRRCGAMSEMTTDGSKRTQTSESQCPVEWSAPQSPHDQSLKFDPGGRCLADIIIDGKVDVGSLEPINHQLWLDGQQ